MRGGGGGEGGRGVPETPFYIPPVTNLDWTNAMFSTSGVHDNCFDSICVNLNKILRVAVRARGITLPEHSEHFISVNEGAGGTSIPHFVVYEHTDPKWVVLILHPIYKARLYSTAADDVTPVLRYEEYMSEEGQANVWADHGAFLVWLVGFWGLARKVYLCRFCQPCSALF